MAETTPDTALERVVVVSPHLDDAVFSLGATIASLARRGVVVEVLTVLAGAPDSVAPAGGWDRRAGFATEGVASAARRAEDASACAILGAHPHWLPYGDGDYARHGTDAEIVGAVVGAAGGASTVLLPGYPLRHADHAWLSLLLRHQLIDTPHVGLYVEEPYAWWDRKKGSPSLPAWLGKPVTFSRVRAKLGDRITKGRAIRAYTSQLEVLGLRRMGGANVLRLLSWEVRTGGESVAWDGEPSPLLPH
ncbi:MAG: PIG-L family deacetylase [Thermoleophilia bacterium]|nr:PIG-L family deacetylase [Thermoleophilia bacterium]MDH4339964.1 PIG-L family deacetylase [Thermoleophilia bacterium]MDH5280566.1 PIG-L family deacetylase [Thermoleophilia bacterium]